MQTDDLISLKDDMIAFIAGHGLRRFSGYVTDEVPTVLFEDQSPDGWKDFVEHAKEVGASLITMSEVALDEADVGILVEQIRNNNFTDNRVQELEDAEYLVRYVGKLGYLQLGFPHQGVMFLFETATEWYDNFQELMASAAAIGGLTIDRNDSDD